MLINEFFKIQEITKVERKIPEGNVFVVCARISESEKLWDEIPESMFEFISRVATAVQNVFSSYKYVLDY